MARAILKELEKSFNRVNLMKRFKQLVKIGIGAAKAKFFNKRIPLFVGWAITNQCNLKCLYCNLWKNTGGELPTDQILNVIDELTKLGTVLISFTGGEPLMRDDIGEIINFASKRKLKVRLNSNGVLVKRKITELKRLDFLNLSLDGPEDIHDVIRGKATYDDVLIAARAAKEAGIKLNFTTVLTRLNYRCIVYVLDLAREHGTTVSFQPVTRTTLGSSNLNPLSLSESERRHSIKILLDKKRSGNNVIANSLTALKYLYGWPSINKIKCVSGLVSCRI